MKRWLTMLCFAYFFCFLLKSWIRKKWKNLKEKLWKKHVFSVMDNIKSHRWKCNNLIIKPNIYILFMTLRICWIWYRIKLLYKMFHSLMRSYHSLLSSVVSEHIFTENSIDFSPILMKGFFFFYKFHFKSSCCFNGKVVLLQRVELCSKV